MAVPERTPYVPVVEPSPVNRNKTEPKSRTGPGVKKQTSPAGSSADPRWKAAMENHAKSIRGYQKELDRILASHHFDWSKLSEDPKDRLKCEEILKRWSQAESLLQETYRSGGQPAPVALPTPSLAKEELNAADIGR